MRRLIVGMGLLAVAGVATAGPRAAGFDAVAASGERLDVTGAGWGRSGDFRLGQAKGSFRRDLDRREWAIEPVAAVEHEGGLRFAVSGPEVRGRLEGRCYAYQGPDRLGGGALTIAAAVPYGMRCAFSRDGVPTGELTLDAAFRRGVSVETARIGEMRIGDTVLAVRSVHRFEGSRWPTSSPLGYLFEREGRAVAAVDVNGARKRLALPRDGAQREAAIAAGLALALAWDPEDQD